MLPVVIPTDQLVETYWPKVEAFIAEQNLDSTNPEHQAKINEYVDELLDEHLANFAEAVYESPEIVAIRDAQARGITAEQSVTEPAAELVGAPAMSEAMITPVASEPVVMPQFSMSVESTQVEPEMASPAVVTASTETPTVAEVIPAQGTGMTLEQLRAQILAHTPSYTAPVTEEATQNPVV